MVGKRDGPDMDDDVHTACVFIVLFLTYDDDPDFTNKSPAER